jgi:hypothetical protein
MGETARARIIKKRVRIACGFIEGHKEVSQMAPHICLKNIPSYSTQYGIEKARELSTRGAERAVGRSAAGAAVEVAETAQVVSLGTRSAYVDTPPRTA